MFCTKCGSQMDDNALFCGNCGAPRDAAPVTPAEPVPQEQAQSLPGFTMPNEQPFPNQGYTHNEQYAPNQGYAPSEQYAPNQGYTPNEQYAPNQGYTPNEQYAPNQGYAPNEQYVPNQAYSADPSFAYGAQNQAYSPYPPAQSAPKKGSGLKTVLILLGIVAIIAVALVALFVSGIFDNDTAKVAKAFTKTGEAYSGTVAELGMPDLSKQMEKQEASQSISLWIDELSAMPELEGFGFRMDSGASLDDRVMELILTPYYGSVDLLDLNLKFEDNALYIGSPELTDDTYYMVDMSTLGDDLADLGAGDELAGLNLNVFELMEIMNNAAVNEDAIKILEKALDEFKDSLEIKKTGSETIDVNSYDIKCTAYHVVMDEEDFNILLDALEEYMNGIDMTQMYTDLFKAMGMPQEMLDEMEASLADADIYGEMFDELRSAVGEIGTVELDVYLSDGYVMSVVYEGSVDGSDLVVSADFGGGKNYVDDLSVRIEADGSEMALISTGNHAGKDGLFTDETTLEMDGMALMTSDFSYDSKSDSDNLFWEIDADVFTLSVEGNLTTGKDSMTLRVDELTASQYGESLGFAVGFEYTVGSYQGSTIDVDDSVEILALPEAELQAEAEKIMMNAYTWLADIAQEVPALQEMLAGVMS